MVKTPDHVAKIAASLRGRTHSEQTRQRIGEAMRGGGSTSRTCEACGRAFEAVKPSSTVRFCSRACGYAQRRGENAPNWRQDAPIVACQVCGTGIRVIGNVGRETCSYLCKNIAQRRRQRTSGTDIERMVAAAMDRYGWHYEQQVGIPCVGTPDFVIPERRIVIFCDGDYWHSLPVHIARDERQTVTLTAMGYQVFRFLGSQIHADVDACLSHVRAAMDST